MTTTRSISATVPMIVLWVAFALLVVATMFVLLRACGLVLPGYGSWHRVGFAYCTARATPAQADEQRTRALRELARQLELRAVQQQANCLAQLPPPVAPRPAPQEAAKPEPPKPEPPKPEPPKPEPQKEAAPKPAPTPQLQLPPKPTTDLSFLKGCWRTDPFQHRSDGPKGVSTYCFDEKGKGTLEYTQVANPSHVCRPAATASYEGQQLRIQDSDTKCSDGTAWYADHLDCRRGANDVAECSGQATTTAGTDTWTVKLHRVR